MTLIVGPLLFCLFVWWASTGVILYLDGLPRRTFRWSWAAISIISAVALFAIGWSANDDSSRGAYIAFLCALVLWGWNEMGFLMGFVTGPRRAPCPPNSTGWKRVRFGHRDDFLYHEVAIAGTAGLIAWMTHGGPNRFALWTFLLLWAMRISAKLNVFLGVRNLSEDWLPDHLQIPRELSAPGTHEPVFPGRSDDVDDRYGAAGANGARPAGGGDRLDAAQRLDGGGGSRTLDAGAADPDRCDLVVGAQFAPAIRRCAGPRRTNGAAGQIGER